MLSFHVKLIFSSPVVRGGAFSKIEMAKKKQYKINMTFASESDANRFKKAMGVPRMRKKKRNISLKYK